MEKTLLIIAIFVIFFALFTFYHASCHVKKSSIEQFTEDEIKQLEDKINKDNEERLKIDKQILDNIEAYESKQGELEDILEKDINILNSKYTGEKLQEQTTKLMNNYNINLQKIINEIDILRKKLRQIREIR